MLTTKIVAAAVLALAACAGPPADDERADPANVASTPQAAFALPPVDVHVTNSVSDPVKTAPVGTTQVAGNVNAAQTGAWNVGILSMPTVNTAQSGPWNVGILSMPTVSSAQSGPWTMKVDGAADVNVLGTPNVNVLSLPSVNVASMPPVNVTVDPGSIQVAGEAEHHPFQHTINATLSFGSSTSDVGNFIVPAGQRLVVEHVTALAQIPAGQIAWIALHTVAKDANGGDDIATWVIPMTLLGHRNSTTDIWQVSAPVRFYELAGRQLGVTINRLQGTTPDLSGNADFQVSTSGYLLDLP